MKIFYFIICSTLLFSLGCSSSSEDNTEVINMEKIVPQAKREYDYNEKDTVDKHEQIDPFILSISQNLDSEVKALDQNNIKDNWRYMPDRLSSDSSLHKVFQFDQEVYVYRMWQYSDSIRSINAFYNWLDCFGPACKGIEIDDSISVSKESFLLFQSNNSLHFLKSTANLNEKDWINIIADKKNTSWNYLIKQNPGGILQWVVIPD